MPRVKTISMNSSATRIGFFGTTTTSESDIQIFVGRTGLAAVEGGPQVELRRHQTPVVVAAKHDDVAQVRADLPTARHRNRLQHRRRPGQFISAGLGDLAEHIDVARHPVDQHGDDLDALDLFAIGLAQLDAKLLERQPWAWTTPTAGSEIVPSGVTRASRFWPPRPNRASTAFRKSSSLLFTRSGETVIAGTL